MLIDAEKSLLLIVDVQERLVPAVEAPQQLLDNCRWLLEIARYLEVPVLASEQYPQGIGPTCDRLREQVADDEVIGKTWFSCMSDPTSGPLIDDLCPQQAVVVGIEAHVCVLQTALELKSRGREVFVVADCIASRNPADKLLAIERMRQAGIQIVSREMVAFEWMRRAATDSFRHISKHYLR
ncbi:hydrolase [Marinobacterium nitratireducens]|uniref:Hydrolase n=1 Tax=Marinobacterium nitratireducens TaxID=518897 RepID=A0A918DQB3_9GAMM|nr:hydrolase [Marinobacterium nitratireducens]GGO77049.1 hydrolase [Marinobacterium nitratireducens]